MLLTSGIFSIDYYRITEQAYIYNEQREGILENFHHMKPCKVHNKQTILKNRMTSSKYFPCTASHLLPPSVSNARDYAECPAMVLKLEWVWPELHPFSCNFPIGTRPHKVRGSLDVTHMEHSFRVLASEDFFFSYLQV